MKLYIGFHRTEAAIVIGNRWGPCVLAARASLAEALDYYDEHYGRLIEEDDPALRDYGDTLKNALESAVSHGDARYGPEGAVWVEEDEWMREFRTVREAGAWLRLCSNEKLEVTK